jgi:hypothetical protein
MWISMHLWKTRASLRTDMDVPVNSEETENESLSMGWLGRSSFRKSDFPDLASKVSLRDMS